MITRAVARWIEKSRKSVLLLGPRQTGKSTLIESWAPGLTINLAHEATFAEVLGDPRELEKRLEAARPKSVFIDEIQRLPSLLNTIQVLLDRPGAPRFYLTGSSARKLRRGHANLLPGRIHSFYLGPLICRELDYKVDTQRALSIGSLPGIYTDPDEYSREKTLRSYAATYLKEEIQAEGLSRNLEGFARFLQIAAQWAGRFTDLSKMAASAQVARQSAVRYFEVLQDCLIVHQAEPFAKSLTRRLVQHPRYYFFDIGVLNGLLGNFTASLDRIGLLFEHLVFGQLIHGAQGSDQDVRVSTYRTEHGAEVDFVVERGSERYAIEVKASRTIGSSDLSGLKHFADYAGRKHRSFVFYLGDAPKKVDGVDILPWQDGIRALGF